MHTEPETPLFTSAFITLIKYHQYYKRCNYIKFIRTQ